MNFVSPSYLWLVFLLPVLALLLLRSESIRAKRAALVGALVHSHGRILISLLIAGALVTALLRPYWGYREVEVSSVGRDIIVLFDVSKSMLARDASPSRIEAAKRKLEDLVHLVEERSPGDRIGIILFAGDASLLCPLTADYDILISYTHRITPELISAQGSSLNGALYLASFTLKDAGAKYPVVFIFSDGEDNALNLEAALKAANENGLRVDTIGFGSKEGSPIPLSNGSFVRDKDEKTVISRLNETSLQELAQRTSGRYVKASISTSDLETIFSDLSSIHSSESLGTKRSFRVYNELGPFFVWISLAILILCVIRRRADVIFVLFFLLTAQKAIADSSRDARSGWEAYSEGDYEEAFKKFQSAWNESTDDPRVLQGLGSSEFKLGRFSDAEKHFAELSSIARNGKEKFEALYDRGNSLLSLKNPKEAIKSYEEALTIKPGDERTLHNLEIARKLLEEEKKSPPTPTPSSQSAQPSPSPAPSPEPSSENSKGDSDSEKTKDEQSKESDSNEEKEKKSEDKKESSEKKEGEKQDQQEGKQEENKEEKAQDEEEKKEGKNQSTAPGSPTPSAKELSAQEAQAWIQSLPEYPLILRRKSGKGQSGDQTW